MSIRLFVFFALVVGHTTGSTQQVGTSDAASMVWSPIVIERLAYQNLYGVDDVDINVEAGMQFLEQAAAAGRPSAIAALAEHYWSGNHWPTNRVRALELYREAAMHGHASAQSFLGWAYYFGQEVERDPSVAKKWFEAAARQGDGFALYYLGLMYGNGYGVASDGAHARELVLRAAALGQPDAWREAAYSLVYGPPDLRDVDRGLDMLAEKAAVGDGISAYWLAYEYMTGANVKLSYADAAVWLRAAAETEHVLASLWLAELLDRGFGVETDRAEATSLRDRVLASASIDDRAAFAQLLTTIDNERLRNADRAAVILQRVLDQAVPEHHWRYLTLLAEAYEESGRLKDAARTLQAAIAAVGEDAPSSTTDRLVDRLAQYRQLIEDEASL